MTSLSDMRSYLFEQTNLSINNNQEVLMNIISLNFEEPLIIRMGNDTVKVIPFKTAEHGNIKFGVDAPRVINVHREEIFHAIKQKELNAALAEQ
jgi:carbon storage regulator